MTSGDKQAIYWTLGTLVVCIAAAAAFIAIG